MNKGSKWSLQKKLALLAGGLFLVLLIAYQFRSGSNLQGKFTTGLTSTLTKAEALKMLVDDVLDEEEELSIANTCTFSKITGTEWYATYYYTACSHGWISGDSFGYKVDPTGAYTRAEVSELAYKIYSVAAYIPAPSSYSDVSPSSTYYKYIESLNHAGAYSSTSGTFGPDETVTKAFMLYMTGHMGS